MPTATKSDWAYISRISYLEEQNADKEVSQEAEMGPEVPLSDGRCISTDSHLRRLRTLHSVFVPFEESEKVKVPRGDVSLF